MLPSVECGRLKKHCVSVIDRNLTKVESLYARDTSRLRVFIRARSVARSPDCYSSLGPKPPYTDNQKNDLPQFPSPRFLPSNDSNDVNRCVHYLFSLTSTEISRKKQQVCATLRSLWAYRLNFPWDIIQIFPLMISSLVDGIHLFQTLFSKPISKGDRATSICNSL